jgi:hypothetical protein
VVRGRVELPTFRFSESVPGNADLYVLSACWMPPGPGLVLLLCWPQQPGQPSRLHPGPGAVTPARAPARGPKTSYRRQPLVHRPSRYPRARPGMTHRDEQSMRRRTESTHIAESVLGNIWPMVPSCTHISFNLAQPIGWSRQAMSLASRTRSGIAATRPRTENAITADRRIFHSFSA